MSEAEKKPDRVAKLLDALRDPPKLRAALTVAVLAAWYLGFCMNLTAEIADDVRLAARERRRTAQAVEIEHLREQVARFDGRLPRKTDANEWVQYMLAGTRKFPLKLTLLDTDPPKELGPYKAIVLKVNVEGTYANVDAYLRWLEDNPRLLRVDSVRIDPLRNGRGAVDARFIVLGVMG